MEVFFLKNSPRWLFLLKGQIVVRIFAFANFQKEKSKQAYTKLWRL
jgi:hypothetical protein